MLPFDGPSVGNSKILRSRTSLPISLHPDPATLLCWREHHVGRVKSSPEASRRPHLLSFPYLCAPSSYQTRILNWLLAPLALQKAPLAAQSTKEGRFIWVFPLGVSGNKRKKATRRWWKAWAALPDLCQEDGGQMGRWGPCRARREPLCLALESCPTPLWEIGKLWKTRTWVRNHPEACVWKAHLQIAPAIAEKSWKPEFNTGFFSCGLRGSPLLCPFCE